MRTSRPHPAKPVVSISVSAKPRLRTRIMLRICRVDLSFPASELLDWEDNDPEKAEDSADHQNIDRQLGFTPYGRESAHRSPVSLPSSPITNLNGNG